MANLPGDVDRIQSPSLYYLSMWSLSLQETKSCTVHEQISSQFVRLRSRKLFDDGLYKFYRRRLCVETEEELLL